MTAKTTPKSLVLVIGAGASREVRLPTGNELKDKIAKSINIRYENGFSQSTGDEVINSALHQIYKENTQQNAQFNNALAACWRIRDGMPQAISIDNFIDSNKSNNNIATCGKLAIVKCILNAEAQSMLFVDKTNINNHMDFIKIKDTWYTAFFQLLTENCQDSEVVERLKKITLIVFNYDRCIEHYLYYALQNYYAMSPDVAAKAIAELEIHHPYGHVGPLPWMDPTVGIDFGARPSPLKLVNLAAQLKTFTEGTSPNTSDITAIRSSITSAKRIAFLGFAYHRLNLDLLFNPHKSGKQTNAKPIYGTAMGISQNDIDTIKTELVSLGSLRRESITLRHDLTCSQLFREYWRNLSLL